MRVVKLMVGVGLLALTAGACAGSANRAALAACVVDQVECRFCNMYKAADALGAGINCATWSGEPSCPP
jgi:hypothetical protein